MNLPADNFILLSVINTALRDKYSSFEELCEEEGVESPYILSRLAQIGYSYDSDANCFK